MNRKIKKWKCKIKNKIKNRIKNRILKFKKQKRKIEILKLKK